MPIKHVFTLFLLVLMPVATIAADGGKKIVDRSVRESGEVLQCTIEDVDDGDTVDLLCGEMVIPSVRLLGVNAPDIVMPENKKHCYYDKARNVMRKIQKDARKLSVQFYGSDLCADGAKWCRNLVRLIDEDTRFDVNERLVEGGFAFAWTDFSMVPARIRARYQIAEKRAQEAKIWLWGSCEVKVSYAKTDSSVPDKMTW